MAVHIGLVTIVVPRNCVEAVYPGGFDEYKKEIDAQRRYAGTADNWFNEHPPDDFIWYDEKIVIVDISMGGSQHNNAVCEYWESFGLDSKVHIGFVDPIQGSHTPWLILGEDWMIRATEKVPKFE